MLCKGVGVLMGEYAVLGIDIGGTKLRIGLVDETFTLLDFFLTQEHRFLTPWELVDFIVENVDVFLQKHSPKLVLGIGVGYPGPVDFVRGTTFAYSNLLDEHWRDVPLAQMLTKRLSLPVWVDNDANLVGLAEMYLGAGKDFTHWVYVTISTGLGGAIFIDRKLYRGFMGGAGEFGHMVVDIRGRRCKCGTEGCLMSLLSGLGIERLIQEDSSCQALFQEKPESSCVEKLVMLAISGQKEAKKAIQPLLVYFQVAFLNIIQVLNPEAIVVGGSLGKVLWKNFQENVWSYLRDHLPWKVVEQTSIIEAKLDDRGGVLGGAILALQEGKWERR